MGKQSRVDRDEEARWSEWMAAAQRGSKADYDRLLKSVLPRLRAFVRARVRDPSLAEDVLQNVLLSVHQARHTYRPERPFGPWLRAIARNAVIDAMRSRGVRTRVEVPLAALESLPGESETPEPGASEISPVLARALAELPPTQREAVELLHLHELSSAEAAERLGISAVALRVRAHRGYKALRAKLQREDL
jgi:RNA polymerase sigma-70 factor (ECF subfamily)